MSGSTTWDVLVVGSGGAGLAAACRAAEGGASVLVVNKGVVGRSGATITSGGGISVAGQTLRDRFGFDADPADTEQVFFDDTWRAGRFLGTPSLIRTMVEDVGEQAAWILDLGVKPKVSKRAPGHSSGRGIHVSGVDLQRILLRAAVAQGVRFRERFQADEVVLDADGACGVAGLDRPSGEIESIAAKCVVLATGGLTSNWSLRTAPEELGGDGHAMALRAGAEVVDLEMLQFLPCCLLAPALWRGLQFPWIMGPQSGVIAWLLNRHGERFMARWDADNLELAPRDTVSAACAAEVFAGRGSPSGGVYLSWRHLPTNLIDDLSRVVGGVDASWHWQGFDMSSLVARIRAGEALEVAPAAHFSLGGIRADVDGRTAVSGLYACGEATGGLHGANRLSGNAGAQILVQGARTGRAAAGTQRGAPAPKAEHAACEAVRTRLAIGGQAGERREKLLRVADRALAPVRNQESLATALQEIRDMRSAPITSAGAAAHPQAWRRDDWTSLESAAAQICLEAALLGAEKRDHSIGAHYRSDCPTLPATSPREQGVIRLNDTVLDHRFVPAGGSLKASVISELSA